MKSNLRARRNMTGPKVELGDLLTQLGDHSVCGDIAMIESSRGDFWLVLHIGAICTLMHQTGAKAQFFERDVSTYFEPAKQQ